MSSYIVLGSLIHCFVGLKRWENNRLSGLIYKPKRGMYRHIKYREDDIIPESTILEENKIQKEPKKIWKKMFGTLKRKLRNKNGAMNNE